MGIQALEAPTRNVGSKYDFSDEDLKAAVSLLKEGKWPGDTGYEKEGQARSAATRLLEQLSGLGSALGSMETDVAQMGSRVWQTKDAKGKDNGWAFVLKAGKRKPNGEGEPAAE